MSLRYKKYIKHIAKWTAVGVLALLLVAGALFGLVQTEWGKRHVVGWVSSALSRDPDIRVKAVGLRGLVPFSVQLDSMVISDDTGDWLRIEDVNFKWSPVALLKGRFHINKLHIAAVHFDRAPFSPKEKQDHQSDWPDWAARMASLVVEEFSLQNLSVGDSLLGERANFTIRGAIETEKDAKLVRSFLHIDRTDGPRASVRVDWALEGREDPLLTLDAALREEEGRLFETVLGLKDAGAILIELQGQGPIKAWKGRLIAQADHIGKVESEIELGIQKALILKGDGHITVSPSLLPSGVAPLLKDGRTHFVLDVRYDREKELAIHRFDCEGEGFDLKLEGGLDLRNQMINLALASEVRDISFLSEIIDTRVKGQASIEGRLSGAFQKPRSTFSLSVIEPAVGEFHASGLMCDFELEVMGELPSSFQGLSIRTKGDTNGLAHLDKNVVLPETAFHWSATAEVKGNASISISELELSSESLLLHFSGALDPSALSLKGDALLDIQALGPFAGLLGAELAGNTRMQAQLDMDGRSRSFSVDIKGLIKEPGPFPPFLAALVGHQMEYWGHADLTNAGSLKISAFRARTSSAELSGQMTIDLSTKKTSGLGSLRIPRLPVLSEAVGQAIAGSLDLEMEMSGTLPAPRLDAKATGHGVGVNDILIEQVQMVLRVEDLREKPRGHVTFELRQPEYPIKAESDFLWEARQLMLSGLSIAAAGTETTGNLTIDLQDLTGQGSLQGQSDDLLRASSLWGERIGGRASFKAVLLSRDKKQDLELDLQGGELESRFGHANEFALQARVKDLFGAPEWAAEMRMKSFQRGELKLQTLTWAAQGQMKKATFSGSAAGYFRKPFEFQTRGDVDLAPNDIRFRIDQLHGQFADYPFELIPSAVIRRRPHDLILEDVAFHLDKGRFEASGRLGDDDLVLDARLEGLPAEVFSLISSTEFLGSMNGRLHMAGRLDHPEAFVELRIDDIRLKGAAFEGLPPASLLTHMTVEEDRLQADLSLEGLFEKPFRADMEVPAVISLWPLSFSLKAEDEIRGRVSADLDLSLIPALFYWEDQRLDGRLLVDLVLGGGAETPDVKGTVALSDGTYENLRSGTILRDVQFVAECEQNRIVLADARGTDGGSGTVSAQGWVQLFSDEGFPFQWDFAFNNATLVRRDDLTILTSGDLRLSGTPNKTLLSGDLTVGPAEIRIPNRFPPEVPDLEVVEINRSGQGDPERLAGKEPVIRLDLDLRLETLGRVFVRGRGLDSEWKGELHLMGSAGKPSLTGVLSVIRGRYNFLGKPFSLTNGVLTFSGALPPSPSVAISAEHKRSDVTTRIQLSGALTSPDISIESEPPLPSDEVLSNLLFGRGVAHISPIQALQLAQALNAMAGKGNTFDLADRTRRILRVDQVDIKQSDEEDEGASVIIGKYLNENVYVEIEQGVGKEGGKVLSEVELTPNITLESETGTDAHVGVGLNWKWDY
jgi:translocation and assembly module TamB